MFKTTKAVQEDKEAVPEGEEQPSSTLECIADIDYAFEFIQAFAFLGASTITIL